MTLEAVIPTPALVVLVGPSCAGKSTWADANFRPGQVLSSDTFRAYLGAGEDDQTAGTEAFALLGELLAVRLAKGLTTVVDSLALDPADRARYRAAAAEAGVPCVAVGFDTDPALCRDRNGVKPSPIPKTVLDKQLRTWRTTRDTLGDEGFDLVIIDPGPPRLVPASMVTTTAADAPESPAPAEDSSVELAFDLVVSSFDLDGEPGPALTEMAVAAEAAGFRALWLMDHFRQVPQVGRAWDPMYEPYTTLAYLAAGTERLRLGSLVTNVEHRNVGLLAKIIATLDNLSGGRAECGLGAGWFGEEQAAYGYPVNPDGVRLDALEDALQALPILWGPGAKSFEGETLSIPEAMGYPRPVQDPVPILVGGGGERRTLRLAARFADACNVQGPLEVVEHKIEVLRGHCAAVDRDPSEVLVTTLNPLVHAPSGPELAARIEELRPRNRSAESVAAASNAGTTAEHVDRFRALADLGVARACVALTGNRGPDGITAFGPVIDAFR